MMGKTTMKERTVARVRDILATHQPSPIKPETEKVDREGPGRGRRAGQGRNRRAHHE